MAINAIESEFRTSKMADRPEMARNAIQSDFRISKMFAEKKILYRSEMARIAIESEFETSKMADRSEMARNAIKGDFRTSKMSDGSHFVKNFQKKKEVVYRSEMARNSIESEFQISKMADGSQYVKIKKNLKLHIDLKWPEMRSKVNFGHSKWARRPFCKEISKKIKILY